MVGGSMIEFRQVTAKYPKGEQEVFRQLDFQVPVHGFLYLMGESGTGKTTILRLIMKELEPV